MCPLFLWFGAENFLISSYVIIGRTVLSQFLNWWFVANSFAKSKINQIQTN